MKKILTIVAASTMSMLALSSCAGKGDAAADQNDTTLSKATIDSISQAQGAYIGEAILSNFSAIQNELGEGVTKEDIVKGVQLVLSAKEDRGTAIGMQFGVQMLNEMRQLEGLGIKIDRKEMVKSFKEAFLQDSVDSERANMAFGQYQAMVNAVQAQIRAREEARIAQSPEALNNVAAGEAYVAAAKAADPEIVTTESGLSYKIVNKGKGEPVGENKRLKVKYTEKQINDSVIVKTKDEGRIIYITSLNKGFNEGVQLLNVGDHAIFYVPGELAYGVNGIAARNVGPNEMIVYDIEVLGIEK